MPTNDRHPDHDDARDDDDEEFVGGGGLPLSIRARRHPRERIALSYEAVEWLLRRAGGMWGRWGDIPTPMTVAFLDYVDPSQPVAVIRAHLERAYFMNRGLADVVVALCSFAPKVAGPPRLINELVCRPEDYMRVAHGRVHLADWTDGEFSRLHELGGDGQGPEPVVPADALPEGTVGVVQDNGYVRMLGEEAWEN